MDIVELGAVGELVGGAAVLLTLIYLARQIRQTNVNDRAESHRAFFHHLNHQVHDPLLVPETSRLLRRANADFLGLEGDDHLVAHGYWQAMTLLGQQAYLLKAMGQFDEPIADTVNRVVLSVMKVPGVAQWWERAQANLTPEYVAYLRALDSAELAPLTVSLPWFAHADGERA